MKVKYLYHGSAKRISSTHLNPFNPADLSKKSSPKAVYASDKKDIARGMAVASCKGVRSFADYEKTPFKIIVIKGVPTGTVYVYKVLATGFIEKPKGSNQWISKNPSKIISRESFSATKLSKYWRLATEKEKKWFFSFTRKPAE